MERVQKCLIHSFMVARENVYKFCLRVFVFKEELYKGMYE